MPQAQGTALITAAGQIAGGVITNVHIAAGAAIVNTKLATNPLARANHSGNQVANTISDFAARVGDSGSVFTNKTFNNDAAGNSITNLVNASIKAAAGIVATKLATIATAGKVSGAALTLLGNTPGGGGQIPVANLTQVPEITFVDTQVFDGNAPTSHTDLDLSSVVGANETLVFLKVLQDLSGSPLGVEFFTKGDTDDPQGAAGLNGGNGTGIIWLANFQNQFATVLVKTDGAGKIEWLAESGQAIQIDVIAYIQ